MTNQTKQGETVMMGGREHVILRDHGAGTYDVQDVTTGQCYRVTGMVLRPVRDSDRRKVGRSWVRV